MTKHMETTECCTHTFTPVDIKPPLLSPKQALETDERLYGGNAKWFAKAKCPDCDKAYWLWLMPVPRGYKVLTISAVDASQEAADVEPIDIESADASQLRAYLKSKNIKFFNGASEDQLRELAAETLALL